MTTSMMPDLTPYLAQVGLRIKGVVQNVEIQAWCPAHVERKGQADTKPSFFFNQRLLVGHCWSCDWKVGSLESLVSYLTGGSVDSDIINEARSYSLQEGVREIGKAKKTVFDQRRILGWEFRQLQPVPERLLAFRHLSAEAAELFDLRFDLKRHCWAIPIHSPRGILKGWQQRQKGAVFNYPAGMTKKDTLFAIHRMVNPCLVLVESPLDAVRLNQCGIPAVASFGAEVSNQQIELLARNCAEVVVALDNDATGLAASERVIRQLRRRTGAVPWRYEGRVKDPGEYESDQEIKEAWKRTRRYGL